MDNTEIMARATLVLAVADQRKVVWVHDDDVEREGVMRSVNWDRGEVRITSTDTGIELWFGTDEVLDMLREHRMVVKGRDGGYAHIGWVN